MKKISIPDHAGAAKHCIDRAMELCSDTIDFIKNGNKDGAANALNFAVKQKAIAESYCQLARNFGRGKTVIHLTSDIFEVSKMIEFLTKKISIHKPKNNFL